MAPLLLARAMVCWLAVGGGRGGGVTAEPNLRQVQEIPEGCPRCDMMFTMVETLPSGGSVQHIEMVERGEPKSGTTFMYHWAHGALVHTCNFLNEWFGSNSCQMIAGKNRGMFHTPEALSLVFDPLLGRADAKCPCNGVDRVEIAVTDDKKHSLPVARGCRWQHPAGLAKQAVRCSAADGSLPQSYFDIWLCMEEAACPIIDERHQFVIMRDPRATAVSTFFHEVRFPSSKKITAVGGTIHTLDEFALAIAPVLCQWVTLRYLLFSTILGPKSSLFWYDEAFSNAHQWHYDWLASVGVHVPEPVIETMANAALREDFDFDTKGRNDHPGIDEEKKEDTLEGTQEEKPAPVHRPTWKELLRPETLLGLDVIARQWLPPAVLVKLKIPEAPAPELNVPV